MFAQFSSALHAHLSPSTQTGGYLTTTVFVDGSFWEKTQQAGAGVYFQTPDRLEEMGWMDERSDSFACPEYRSALGAELFASYQALLLYFERSYPHEQIDRSAKWLPPNYEEPVRQLLIKQDCQKAIRMIRFCLAQQSNDRFLRAQYEREIKDIHRTISICGKTIQSLQIDFAHAQIRDRETWINTDMFARSMGVVIMSRRNMPQSTAIQARIDQESKQIQRCKTALATHFPPQYICSFINTPLHRLFSKRERHEIIDASHDQFNITMADVFDHLPLLEQIVGIVHMKLFDVRWEYVKGHQQIPQAHTTDEFETKTHVHVYSQEDHHGNERADAFAKDGSRKCSIRDLRV